MPARAARPLFACTLFVCTLHAGAATAQSEAAGQAEELRALKAEVERIGSRLVTPYELEQAVENAVQRRDAAINRAVEMRFEQYRREFEQKQAGAPAPPDDGRLDALQAEQRRLGADLAAVVAQLQSFDRRLAQISTVPANEELLQAMREQLRQLAKRNDQLFERLDRAPPPATAAGRPATNESLSSLQFHTLIQDIAALSARVGVIEAVQTAQEQKLVKADEIADLRRLIGENTARIAALEARAALIETAPPAPAPSAAPLQPTALPPPDTASTADLALLSDQVDALANKLGALEARLLELEPPVGSGQSR